MDPKELDGPPDADAKRDLRDSEESGAADAAPIDRLPAEPRLFQHQPWMVGIILIFAMAAIIAGLSNPVWLLIGSPCILALALYVAVRLFSRR